MRWWSVYKGGEIVDEYLEGKEGMVWYYEFISF